MGRDRREGAEQEDLRLPRHARIGRARHGREAHRVARPRAVDTGCGAVGLRPRQGGLGEREAQGIAVDLLEDFVEESYRNVATKKLDRRARPRASESGGGTSAAGCGGGRRRRRCARTRGCASATGFPGSWCRRFIQDAAVSERPSTVTVASRGSTTLSTPLSHSMSRSTSGCELRLGEVDLQHARVAGHGRHRRAPGAVAPARPRRGSGSGAVAPRGSPPAPR